MKDDLISREQAKKFLYEEIERLHDDGLYDCFSRIIDDMYNELPSVTPLPKDDCISREQAQEIYEKYSQIVELMDGVIMNPPPYCRPYKHTTRKKIYDTMYKIQRIIGKVRFANEEMEKE